MAQEYDEESMREKDKEVFQSERREDWGALILAAIAIIISFIVGRESIQYFFDEWLKYPPFQ